MTDYKESRLSRVAIAQIPVDINDVAANLEAVVRYTEEASAAGVELIVFPECCLTGYMQNSPEESRQAAVSATGPELARIAELAGALRINIVVGYLELASNGETVHNTATLLTPEGTRGDYRKAHLPFLGADRFVTPGMQEPVVVDTSVGPVGLSICYDIRFPEWARCLSLAGAAIMVHPTNWAIAASQVAVVLPPARAFENSLYVLAANRGDAERNTEFAGLSSITDPGGNVLAMTDRGTHLLIRDIDVSMARRSKVVFIPGEFEVDFIADRRPELYHRITQN